MMGWMEITRPTLEENLAYDEWLLQQAESGHGGEVLRFWEWPREAVVLGAGGVINREVDEAACVEDGVPIVRRSSGGGAVLLGPGCLLYTLILSQQRTAELRHVSSSYRWILSRIKAALKPIADVELQGTSDLSLAGRKVSGNAQQRKSRFLLHHGTLLYRFATTKVARYLPVPAVAPDYRRGRSHADFLGNLPADPQALRRLLSAEFQAQAMTAPWADTVTHLAQTRYGDPAWIRRR